jgi:hypothetical protein
MPVNEGRLREFIGQGDVERLARPERYPSGAALANETEHIGRLAVDVEGAGNGLERFWRIAVRS